MPATLLKNARQRYLTAIFVVELFFNQIARINSRPACNFTEKKAPPRRFFCKYIRIFSASTEGPNMSSV